MARKLEAFPLEEDGKVVGTRYWFVCPGCGQGHAPQIRTDGKGPSWMFQGSVDFPTFHPSVLVHHGDNQSCHFFIRQGRIEFLEDCTHHLAGKIVDMPDI